MRGSIAEFQRFVPVIWPDFQSDRSATYMYMESQRRIPILFNSIISIHWFNSLREGYI